MGEGAFRGKASPTYVYPDPLKAAIREILEDNLRDYPNPETPAVVKGVGLGGSQSERRISNLDQSESRIWPT